MTIRDAIEQIDIETFAEWSGIIDGLDYSIKLIGGAALFPMAGDWRDLATRNIETMRSNMERSGMDEADLTMSFPHKNVGYTIEARIRKPAPELQISNLASAGRKRK